LTRRLDAQRAELKAALDAAYRAASANFHDGPERLLPIIAAKQALELFDARRVLARLRKREQRRRKRGAKRWETDPHWWVMVRALRARRDAHAADETMIQSIKHLGYPEGIDDDARARTAYRWLDRLAALEAAGIFDANNDSDMT
jgi:hypothetical protein